MSDISPDDNASTSAEDPFALFDRWLAEARASEPNDGEAMTLASVDGEGRPSARMVLLKGHGADGFVFYTNLESRKAGDIRANPHVALLFHWKSLRRQVRIEGSAAQVDDATADAYFASRPRESQLGAWASDQSRPLADRQIFRDRIAAMEARFARQDVPRPPHWSGFRVVPARMEFWSDRAHRLHERSLYLPDGAGGWRAGYLYP